jgi:polyketide biosynthesis acyl carrier protein
VSVPDGDRVFAVVCEQVASVVPGAQRATLTPATSLRALGANSLDRLDVVVGCLDDLDADVPAQSLGGLDGLGELAEAIAREIAGVARVAGGAGAGDPR